MSTPQLAESIMNYMKASDDRITIYKKHLALLVSVIITMHMQPLHYIVSTAC